MNRFSRLFRYFLATMTLAVAAYAVPAGADMIGTDEAVSASPANERESLKALVARPEVAKQLQSLGLPPEKAQARVDAMTDKEVRTLAGQLSALPAGGNFSDYQWVMIIIGVVIIALLV